MRRFAQSCAQSIFAEQLSGHCCNEATVEASAGWGQVVETKPEVSKSRDFRQISRFNPFFMFHAPGRTKPGGKAIEDLPPALG
jgi:hypothetical protein